MSAITPASRAAGWNVLFTIGPTRFPCTFAGTYQVVGSNLITFRDVCNELRLCFNFPNNTTCNESGSNNDNPWDSIAFALADRPDLSLEMRRLSVVHGEHLDKPVPSLPPIHPMEQDVLKYHIVFHETCSILPSEPLSLHLKRKMPLRRTLQAGSPKRFRSGSNSPTNGLGDNNLEDIDMVAPKNLEINEEVAKKTQNSFRHNCLARGNLCAVSRQGQPWCLATPVGPTIRACHIVPQIQYHVYPCGDDTTTIDTSPRGLLTAWEKTWSPNNGILLGNSLHELFDARLFSIHPTTFQVRTFVPFDILIQYHGNKAFIHPETDINALRHHYEMCCIENMAAEKPQVEDYASLSTSMLSTRGKSELGTATPSLPPTPGSEVDSQDGFITPCNSRDFLANVNWELRKFQALHCIH